MTMFRRRNSKYLFISFFFSTFLPVQIWSMSTAWQTGRGESSEVRIILDTDSIKAGDTEIRGLVEFKLKSGWHVYWKSPGEIGLPPKITWQMNSNWVASELKFLPPERIESQSSLVSDSFGYKTKAFYPFILTGKGSLSAKVRLDYLICEVQCIPERLLFNLVLPEGNNDKINSSVGEIFKKIPAEDSRARQKIQLTYLPQNKIVVKSDEPLLDLFASATEQELVRIKSIKIGPHEWHLELPKDLPELEFTFLKENEVSYSTYQLHPTRTSQAKSESFWWALLFALLGGLILNLMPCVLPVLVLKTNSVIKWGGQTREAKRSFLLTTLGILTSFLTLALITLSLQKIGQKIGWGFQFQNSGFVLLMILFIYFFALNLFGFFNFEIGTKATTRLASVQGSFFEGVFATLLATPCSAPFLGTALTYALQQSAIVLILFYLVMGLGLSTPYLAIWIWPNALKMLPKPGPWMNRLSHILGYSLLATCLWLIYVLHQQIGSAPIFILLFVLILIALILSEVRSVLKWSLIVLLLIASFIGVLPSAEKKSGFHSVSPYSEHLIPEKIAQGKTLFVVVTADWCLTCKYNEKLVIETEWFRDFLERNNAELITFDWTQRNEDIARFLNSYNRVAIPFSAWINNDKKMALPEILTRSVVEESWNEFQKK